MKKIVFIVIIITILIISGVYLYIRFGLLKSKDFPPHTAKSKSALDLRPALIAKLQQMVKDGSGGLYNLSIGTLDPDILQSSLDITNAALEFDSAQLIVLERAKSLPDDIFKILFSALHVEGITISDILSGDHLQLKSISVSGPVIEVYHKKRKYNREKRIENDSLTLYQKLAKNIRGISINSIDVLHGTLINHNLDRSNEVTTLKDIAIHMSNLQMDSVTQFDKKRFLFAEQATLSTKNFYGRTPDSLYFFTCGSIEVSTDKNNLTATDIKLRPMGTKQQFESHLKERQEMYNLAIPKIILSDIDWWELANEESLIAGKAFINGAMCSIFLDRSLPFRKVRVNNFPHQILMRSPLAVSIPKLYFRHTNLSYSEYNPGMEKTGTIYIDDLTGTAVNITNIPAQIKHRKLLTIKSSGLFMHKIPVTNGFSFDLSKYKRGDFTMELDIDGMDTAILNPITAPLGEFTLRKGSIQKGIAHVKGNNFEATGNGELLYRDLYLVGIKKDKNEPGKIKKRAITSFLGNVFLIKNANPSGHHPARYVDFKCKRESKTTFFSLVWKTIFLGILKTIGLPAGFADKPY